MKWRINKGKTIFTAILMLAVLLVGLLIVFRPDIPDIEAPAAQRIAVTTMNVEPQSMADEIMLPARAVPFDDVIVAAEQAGRIIALHIDQGDTVRQNDTLLQIDDRPWRTGLKRAELAMRDARRDVERVRDLRRSGAISQSDLDTAETRFDTAQLALEDAQLQLERCTPSAPLSGIAEKRLVSAGEYVNPGQPLFRLLNTERMKIVFDVPERDVGTLRFGESYAFTLDPYPDELFEGDMRFIAAAADPANNAFRVELWVDNPDGRIRAGMIARARLKRRTIDHAVILPLQAVVPMSGQNIVYVVDADHAVRRIVQLDAIIDGKAVIRHGISEGDEVIIDGNRAVLDGTPVTVDNDWRPAPVANNRNSPE